METQNKIALVTGGSRGLGKNAALKIATKGIGVIITYQSKKEEAEDTVNEIKQLGVQAVALQLNVADTKTFDAFFVEVKAILKSVFNAEKFDFLINNAGIGIHASFAETTEEQFDTLVNIHYKGAFFLTQKALTLLNDGGGIINLSTGLARFATPGYAAYASMKGAMETLTKYQAKELGTRGIRSNIVAPGAIETDFGGGVVRDNDQLNAGIASNTALGRVGLPDDIGGVVAFLCTEDARWINAQRIEASGGMFL
ncbi:MULTISPECIES: SDR family oxidoreductase [unclassified Pedobacter]|uniref:SDR family oxidoreductase n=1 Tax=unclassified Pedobacter TaxID=2628915 RepID=UPI00141F794E|nr:MULTISPECIES: SDR family oxidoreductase [unclassified Pedobacter]NII81606.1 NAD(P)-dependent dehydrogenase (short-subunit alcohol dehydrogenase family) [Pedobacter sp. SG908]NMN35610.1 NAD(P)-dependent dehydrogenase (short-subunit alcohol dehydrogenase family) [Pedobacter sp. SG918]